ncbi:hypothetical protein FF041_24070 [Streptomyces jumonjinensis]|uniref:Uncharacterized protein n=2 Tax=Streptomyces jumonjinensis TaxID=1945 RepID=A0A646KLN1_STRJU|nr:hypothetical protein [Streptomyces jumonjinensis]
MSGLTITTGIVLLAGLRGSDRIELTRDKAGGIGIVFGTLAAAAGDMWGDVAEGVAEVPAALVEGTAAGDVGLGLTALALTATMFLFKWEKLVIPSVLGISAGVTYGQAGGIWGIGSTLVVKLAGVLGAL